MNNINNNIRIVIHDEQRRKRLIVVSDTLRFTALLTAPKRKHRCTIVK